MKKLDDPENVLTNFKGKVVTMSVEYMALALCPKCKSELCPRELEQGTRYFCQRCKTYCELPTNHCETEK